MPTGPTGFEHAFGSIAEAMNQAANIPDHRERPVEIASVTVTSPGGEVEVTVNDAKVQSVRFEQFWLSGADAEVAADLVRNATNEALEEFTRQQMEKVQELYPDVKELDAAITAARSELQDAWVATLAEVKNR